LACRVLSSATAVGDHDRSVEVVAAVVASVKGTYDGNLRLVNWVAVLPVSLVLLASSSLVQIL
jgi:hypothetical protein